MPPIPNPKCDYGGKCIALAAHKNAVDNDNQAAVTLENGQTDEAVLFEQAATEDRSVIDGLILCESCPYRITREAKG